MADLHVMYQPLDGGWVKLGTQSGGGRGVVAESIRLEGDRGEGGCLSASFRLKQDPRWIATQMEKATPIVVMDGAEAIWSGRIAETPMTFGEDDIEVGVNAQGWWQHLKDDCTDREWVVSDLSRWVDARSSSAAVLTYASAIAQVTTGEGAINMGFPNGAAVFNCGYGVVLDLGANNLAKRIVVEWDSTGMNGVSYPAVLYARASATNNLGSLTSNDAFSVDFSTNPGASATSSGTFPTGYRYVFLFVNYTGGAGTNGADRFVRIKSVSVFTDTSDESANASILKASTVITETLDACAPLISPDRSRITTTALSLPQFPGSPGWRYADELIKQANAPHGYLARLTPDPVPVFEYAPIPTDYRFVVSEGQYTLLEPAAQALQGVASRVITEFEDAAGVRSYAESLPEISVRSDIVFPNPSFATDTSNWTVNVGSLTRDTGVFNSSPASGRLNGAFVGFYQGSISTQVTGLRPGRRYRLRFGWRREKTLLSGTQGALVTNSGGTVIASIGWAAMNATTLSTFENVSVSFIAPADGIASLGINVISAGSGVLGYIDDLEILDGSGNVPERRGFVRTFLRPMSQRSTLATAEAIADLELDAAQYPPFKGTIGITGRIPLKGGGSMDVSHLPACVGDNLLIANLHNPNTQGLGRIGNIQSCVYDHDKRQAILGIDRDLSFINELNSRLSLLAR